MTPAIISGISAAVPYLISSMNQGSWSNPADEAMKYYDQIAGTITPYYQPYINAGQQSLDTLMGQLGQLVSNPAAFMSQMSSGFQQSPGYQYNVQQATNAANQAAAAGGMVGSPMEQQQLSQDIMGMANQDFYNYLNHVLKIYAGGMKGLGGINQMGYGASSTLATELAKSLMNQGNLAFAGTQAQNQRNAGSAGMISGALSSFGL